MEHYEVAVIGAGPAGSTCAAALARAGMSVLLMDRETFPREKPCAGWITPEVLHRLDIEPVRYRQAHLLQDIAAFRTGPIYGKEIETRYPAVVSYGIRRVEFDRFLVDRCTAAKALGEQVISLEPIAGGWRINGRIEAAVVVGAGGNHCPVARALGARPASEPIIAAMVAEFPVPGEQLDRGELPAGVPVLCFTEDLRGYGWLMRKGDYVNVGLGSMRVTEIHGQSVSFCSHMLEKYGIEAPKSLRLRGHAYLPYLGRAGRRAVGQGAVLVGDAAGLSFPESGEGILPAVESALLAAEVILSARGNYQKERLERYATELEQTFAGKELGGAGIPQPLRKLAGTLLLSSRYLTRRYVLDKWFLHNETMRH
ncbi:FAD-dependent monooxygenase [Geomesophilobacter sediminis]|uniref:NAD(P)/FAD-dependent oxidoreductase n=1 Tax=Geomesophilobacter sediminis TaxID=2798584 RepID=A0A8J7SA39_9BACT|nr:NAD(P)/FAD-dependent oxidoreductase [Geomesophilobacter sediminis]MBJ6727255.1 NAD(P)/FAD-dependent oxidoreductase [Geomesophilobacter sediminis]